MCKVIAIANQKGGVGKTVTSVNLGIGLAKNGRKVLMIDADPQGSLSISLGIKEPDELDYTLANVMRRIANDEAVDLEEGIIHHEEGVDLLPGNIDLSALEANLFGVISRETILKGYIEKVRSMYDYIIIDCMPSLGTITINVLTCADSVLIPIQAAYLPVKGLQQLVLTISRIRRQLNPALRIEGILLTMVDSRLNYAKDISALVHGTYSSSVNVFRTEIPLSVRASEISAKGTSLFSYDPRGKATVAYEELVKEVLANE